MFLTVLKREFFLERHPRGRRFFEWYFAPDENHLWVGTMHIVWNPVRLPLKPAR